LFIFEQYTYFTTYFIPKDEETISSVVSREVTSTQVGLVKKTFSNVIPAVSASAASGIAPDAVEEEYDEEDVKPSSVRIVYKTFATTVSYFELFIIRGFFNLNFGANLLRDPHPMEVPGDRLSAQTG